MCARKAFWGNTAFANDWQWVFGVPVISGLVGFLAANKGASELTTGYPILDGILTAFGAFVVTWSVAFLVRLFNAPALLYREAKGASASVSGAVVRDVWLYDAICRMFLGRWEKIPIVDGHLDLTASGFQSIHDLINQVKQLAFDDRLPIWGKAQGHLAMWEKPKPAFWQNYQIDYLSFTEGDPTKLRVVPYNTNGQITSLRDLMTSKFAVEQLCRDQSLAIPTNDANSIAIVTGTGKPFDQVEVNQHGVHHTISIGVKNVGSKKETNCSFYRTYLAFTNDSQKTLLDGPFSLDPNKTRYVSIAMFNETKDMPDTDHLIGLSLPPAAFGAAIMAPRLPADRRHAVSFAVESTDTGNAVLHCELWVDEAGKLRLEPL